MSSSESEGLQEESVHDTCVESVVESDATFVILIFGLLGPLHIVHCVFLSQVMKVRVAYRVGEGDVMGCMAGMKGQSSFNFLLYCTFFFITSKNVWVYL